MPKYKFRATCSQDVIDFAQKQIVLLNPKISYLGYGPEVEFEFFSSLPIWDIISIFQKMPSSSMMEETVAEIHDYTGIRKQRFKKAILLIGESQSGKTRMAYIMSIGKNVEKICGRKMHLKKLFQTLSEGTQVIIFDDVDFKKYNQEYFFDWITKGIVIRGTTRIRPQIIITGNLKMKDIRMGASYKSRYDIFELKSCNK